MTIIINFYLLIAYLYLVLRKHNYLSQVLQSCQFSLFYAIIFSANDFKNKKKITLIKKKSI